MVGLATRIVIAQRTAAELKLSGAPESAVIEANERWYYFGALGPAIGDYVPFEAGQVIGAPGRSPYYSVWQKILGIAVGDAAGTPGIVPVLKTFEEFLQKVSSMVIARDFDGLKAMRDSGQLDVVNQASADLGKILTKFSDLTELKALGALMGNDSRPMIINQVTNVPPDKWTGREWLHWKHPGRFATELRKQAEASGDDRLRAYAIGWAVSYGALVCGSGFMNSVVGASYRNQWWRSRWVGNFVDTWTWGFYGSNATIAPDDQPTPPYKEWRSLCAARLHDLIDLTNGLDPEVVSHNVVNDEPLPQVLPPEFVAYWLSAWSSAYGPQTDPLFTADRVQAGYLLLWITLWFQTSGDVIGCNPSPSDTPPDACGSNPTPPGWVDPTQTNPVTGQPFAPPTPNAKHDPSVAEIVSGIILALAGVASIFFGGAAVGAIAIAAGIGMIVDGEKQLNWDELECQLYWLSVYLYNGLDVLHKLAVFGGVQQPYPGDLAVSTLSVQFNGSSLPYTSGAAVCKSRRMAGMQLPWDGALSTWTNYPNNAIEEADTDVWRLAGLWPSAFVDDAAANPASEDLMHAPGAWPGGVKGSFGPAVQACVKLAGMGAAPLPDWNLDGDRGRGWLTWQLSGLYSTTAPVPAVPEP